MYYNKKYVSYHVDFKLGKLKFKPRVEMLRKRMNEKNINKKQKNLKSANLYHVLKHKLYLKKFQMSNISDVLKKKNNK